MEEKVVMPKIYEAISKVMAEIGAIGKNKKNMQGTGYMYRGIDDVMNSLNPAMVKNKVFIVPEILEQTREERTSKNGGTLLYSICKIKYTFYTVDGSSVSAIVIGEAMDSGDKGTNKSMAIAFKYACFQVFCIPTEEMKDPDADTHELAPKTNNPVQNMITAEQIKILSELIVKKGYEVEKMYKKGFIGFTEETYKEHLAKWEAVPERVVTE